VIRTAATPAMYHCSGNANQHWKSTTQLGHLRSAMNGKCLDVDTGTRDTHMWDCDFIKSNQRWTYDHATSTIHSDFFGDSQCLDATTAYGKVNMHECHYGWNQQWDLLPSGEIRERSNGQCLDIYERISNDGANVIAYTCHASENQHWAAGP
jgi:hypothetical protein